MLDVSQLTGLRESGSLEAKTAHGGLPQSMWETYSAFANTDGGTILLGVRELPDHSLELAGIRQPEVLVKQIWDTLNNPNKVNANILADSDVRIEQPEPNRPVIVITVPRAPRALRPVFIGGNPLTGSYRRNGEGDYRMSNDDYLAMVRDADPQPFDANPLPDHSIEELSGQTIAAYRNALSAARPSHPWITLSTDELLLHLGAAARDPTRGTIVATKAGLLMFGQEYAIVQEFPNYFLDYRSYQNAGQERWDDRVITNDGTWSGNVFDFWVTVLPRILKHLRTPFSLDQNMVRNDDTPMHKAAREALANSLIHADYLGKRYVVIKCYPDRLECENPGSMRVPRDIALQGGISDARNPTIMKMFGLINVCEKAGSGFDAIRLACKQAEARAFELRELHDPDRTTLTLYFGNASAQDGSVGLRVGEAPAAAPGARVSEKDQILAYVSLHGQVKRIEVQTLLGVGSTKAKRLLGELVADGALAAVGTGNQLVYVLG